MTTSADWPQGVDPMPSMEPSSDLFDGDILGDELIDIYNAAVVGGGDDSMNEIPSLLSGSTEKKENEAQVPNPQTSEAAVDDGLGAFRPSTSFNDLTTLLPPSSTSGGNEQSQKHEQAATSTAVQAKTADPKKRSSPGGSSEIPAAKRRASGSKKPGTASKAKGSKTVSTVKAAKGTSAKSSQNTPNPLNAVAQPAVAAPGKTQTLKPITKPIAPTSSTSSVVTPRGVSVKVEETSSAPKAAGAAPTEADFKSVAQAAVSNLIANAGTGNETSKKATNSSKDGPSEKIDTSTEHIKALTGSNWVAVCSDGRS
mmetsp:Transcript_103287/g.298772  ORF Transcript_103287/g.298772 Transcript_103287/m.298772 type:complete len:312 (-) Transcript_103287:362-1297(-)